MFKEDLLHLKDGQSFTRSSTWDGNINRSIFEPLSEADLYLENPGPEAGAALDMFMAIGKSGIKADGDFKFSGEGDRIQFEGTIAHRWEDPYDWSKDGATWIPGWSAVFGPLRYEDAVKLQDHGGAEPFMMESEWRRSVKGTLRKRGKRLTLESIQWSDLP